MKSSEPVVGDCREKEEEEKTHKVSRLYCKTINPGNGEHSEDRHKVSAFQRCPLFPGFVFSVGMWYVNMTFSTECQDIMQSFLSSSVLEAQHYKMPCVTLMV